MELISIIYVFVVIFLLSYMITFKKEFQSSEILSVTLAILMTGILLHVVYLVLGGR